MIKCGLCSDRDVPLKILHYSDSEYIRLCAFCYTDERLRLIKYEQKQKF